MAQAPSKVFVAVQLYDVDSHQQIFQTENQVESDVNKVRQFLRLHGTDLEEKLEPLPTPRIGLEELNRMPTNESESGKSILSSSGIPRISTSDISCLSQVFYSTKTGEFTQRGNKRSLESSTMNESCRLMSEVGSRIGLGDSFGISTQGSSVNKKLNAEIPMPVPPSRPPKGQMNAAAPNKDETVIQTKQQNKIPVASAGSSFWPDVKLMPKTKSKTTRQTLPDSDSTSDSDSEPEIPIKAKSLKRVRFNLTAQEFEPKPKSGAGRRKKKFTATNFPVADAITIKSIMKNKEPKINESH